MIYNEERLLVSACGDVMPDDWLRVSSPSSLLDSSSWLMNTSTTSDTYRRKARSHCYMLAAEIPTKAQCVSCETVRPMERNPSD